MRKYLERYSWLIGIGLTAFLASCSTHSGGEQAQVSQAPSGVSSLPNSGDGQKFPDPVVSPTATVTVKAVPGLLQPTNAKNRLPLITVGRNDPFAATNAPPVSLPPNRRSSSVVARSMPPLSTLPTLKPIPVSAAPFPAAPPLNLPSSPLPPAPLKPAPPSRTAMADQIEITGAVQIGGKWQVIVREPGSTTSRYVAAGDYLANGKVLVKRIITGKGVDPVVVLQQNGVEVTKSLGSSGSLVNG